jgi:hypothetical protein
MVTVHSAFGRRLAQISVCVIAIPFLETAADSRNKPRTRWRCGRCRRRAQIRGGESVDPGNIASIIVAAGRMSVRPFLEAVSLAVCERDVHWDVLSVCSVQFLRLRNARLTTRSASE